jgi:hypothetical protein
MTGTCLCGAVSVMLDARPDFIHDCNCSLCRKAGAGWGYFPSAVVQTSGRTISFARTDKSPPGVEVHSCASCGSTTHFVLTEAFKKQNETADLIGVNMRIFEGEDLSGIEVRFPDGKNWTGEGAFGYRREAMTISETVHW